MRYRDDNKTDPDPVKQDGMIPRDCRRSYILLLLYGACALIYYFGELVDLFGWDFLRWDFFYGIHDVHRLFFLAPILYAAWNCGLKAVLIITIISTMTFLPRALFISPYPSPLVRMLLFSLIAGTVGVLMAIVRKKAQQG